MGDWKSAVEKLIAIERDRTFDEIPCTWLSGPTTGELRMGIRPDIPLPLTGLNW
jgi:hypothetical protein